MATNQSAGPTPGGTCCMILFGLPFLLAGLGLFFWGLSAGALARRAETWRAVDAYVVDVEVRTGRTSKGQTTYTLHCTYRYTVDGQEYESSRVGPDVASGAYVDRHPQLAEAREKNQPVRALVDPADP